MAPLRPALVLLSLTAAAVAQASTISLPTAVGTPAPVFTPDAMLWGDLNPSACQNVSIATHDPDESNDPNFVPPLVPAKLMYDCLTSVPVRQPDALAVVDHVLSVLEFQSNLDYLKAPPESYVPGNPPIDLVAELQGLRSTVLDNGYKNELEFEDALSSLLSRAYDGHIAFAGAINFFTATWLRDPRLTLASVVHGTDTLPQIYRVVDLNQTGTIASPVVQINGQNATDFLAAEADKQSFHDPDARWNTMFFSMAGGPSYGYFIEPPRYPGPSTTLTFQNGSTTTFPNYAEPLVGSYPLDGDGDDFYDNYVVRPYYDRGIFYARSAAANDGTNAESHSSVKGWKNFPFRRPPAKNLPKISVDHGKQHVKRDVPYGYPEPFITQSAADNENIFLSGYFAPYEENPSGLGILALQSFLALGDSETLDFQSTIADFLAEARRRNTQKMIIDLSWNAGGTALLAYEAFRQFFPDQGFATTSRFRATQPLNLMGGVISNYSAFEGALFSKDTWFKPSGADFSSWGELYGPQDFGIGSFTSALTVDMCDAVDTQLAPSQFRATGCGTGANLNRPFASEDLIILTNGICASACALFKQFMSSQGNVSSIAIGGRQQLGPMQAIGGTRGGVVLLDPQLDQFVGWYSQYRGPNSASSSAAGLPQRLPIWGLLSVNSQNQYAKGSDVPLQFVQDLAGCRLFITDDMTLDVGVIWNQVALAAWSGPNGGINATSCVSGSVVQEQGKGQDATASTNFGSGSELNNNGGSYEAGATRDSSARGLLAAVGAVSLTLLFVLI